MVLQVYAMYLFPSYETENGIRRVYVLLLFKWSQRRGGVGQKKGKKRRRETVLIQNQVQREG